MTSQSHEMHISMMHFLHNNHDVIVSEKCYEKGKNCCEIASKLLFVKLRNAAKSKLNIPKVGLKSLPIKKVQFCREKLRILQPILHTKAFNLNHKDQAKEIEQSSKICVHPANIDTLML